MTLDSITKQIIDDLELYCQDGISEQGHRTHLGASTMGGSCSREAWYTFRWVNYVRHSGRMMRLFQRGHREEPALVGYLRGLGFKVWEVDENGKQFTIQTESGHGGGSCDGICQLPERYGFTENCLLEFKTANNSSFNKLKREGVVRAKPEHYKQMNMYGYGLGLRFTLYMCVNKNTDEIHIELVELKPSIGEDLFKLTEGVINAPNPPMKASPIRTSYVCKFCDFKEICHDNAPFDKNCRSCKHSVPAKNKTWFCQKWDADIPKESVKDGCGQWEQIENV